MNSSSEVPAAAEAQREARERLEAVRAPWYRWHGPAIKIAVGVMLLSSFFVPTSVAHATWWRAAWLTVTMVLLILNHFLRERAWRQLIEAEAPDLHRKLNGTEA